MKFSKKAIGLFASAVLAVAFLSANPATVSLAASEVKSDAKTAQTAKAAAAAGGEATAAEGGAANKVGTVDTDSSPDTGGGAGTAGSAAGAAKSGAVTAGTAAGKTGSAANAAAAALEEDDESLWYRSQNPMKKEHQKLLWECCKARKLDYIDMLALISLESKFNEKCSNGKCKGYFQISSIHFKNLARTLKTPNTPLDGAVNIKWGTAMYSWALADKRTKGMEGKKLRDAALSIYQRGTGGYDRYGINKKYLARFYKERDVALSWFEEDQK